MEENQLEAFPLGVCLWTPPHDNAARTVQHPAYIHEILSHAGLGYRSVEPDALAAALPTLRILVTVGDFVAAAELQKGLRDWVRAGGIWISVGGIGEMSDVFGVVVEAPSVSGWGIGSSTLGEGYLQTRRGEHPMLTPVRIPLHFFNGVAVRVTDAEVLADVLDAHQRPTSRVAVTEKATGAGLCLLIAPDVTGSIVRIQQGIAIACDGVSAPDGTAGIADEVWKSGDGGVLDWIFDRQPIKEVPGLSGFVEPVADLWREILLCAIFHAANRQGTALALLWLYPRNLPAIAHMSHDTDGNDVGHAQSLLQTLREANIRTAWCAILPGYPAEILTAIREEGHELAMHYNALDAPWSEAEFDSQWRQLTGLFAGESPVTNKNHFLRWEGYLELFDWCEKRGIWLEQSKGAAKMGEFGFNFGTCHPYAPTDRTGKRFDVLELPTPTQDLAVFVSAAALLPLLESVLRRHGVLHLLFHPAHTHRPEVAQALRDAAQLARNHGMEWWTGRQLAQWERARRRLQWKKWRQGGGTAEIRFNSPAPLSEATILYLLPEARRITVNGESTPHQTVERWGFRFQSVVFDALAGNDYCIEAAM